MKIVVTGGHLTPALAVIDELKDHQILYIGRKHALEGDKALSLEYQAITSKDIPFVSITTGRLQRKFTIYTIPSLLKLPVGFFQSLFILKKEKPDIVLGFGGYVELPVIFAAALLRIPVVIHEQTLTAGLANKIAAYLSRKICISWESSRDFFPKSKTILTGTPIRKEIIQSLNHPQNNPQEGGQKPRPLIYITGGSLGSHAINLLVEGSLGKLLKDYDIIHQTGDSRKFSDFERFEKFKNSEGFKNYIVKKFLSSKEIADVLTVADLVVGRAGMSTVTELIYLNKPCFLIPLPFGFEQRQNANFMKKIGLAEVGVQELLSPISFFETINFMIKNKDKYKTTHQLTVENSSGKIAEVVLDEGRKT